jgi:hypothetical protein
MAVVERETAKLILAPELPFQKSVRDVPPAGAVILTPVEELIGAEIVVVIIFSLNNIFELEESDNLVPIIIYQEKKCNRVF